MRMRYQLVVSSDLYGEGTYGPYDTRLEAEAAADRIEAAALELADGVEREYSIEPVSE